MTDESDPTMEQFLAEQFENMRQKKGWRYSQSQWAKFLGVSHQSLSQWMNGYRLPTGDNVHILADKLGPKVYDILGQPRRMPEDPMIQRIVELYYQLGDEDRQELEDYINKLGTDPAIAPAQA